MRFGFEKEKGSIRSGIASDACDALLVLIPFFLPTITSNIMLRFFLIIFVQFLRYGLMSTL